MMAPAEDTSSTPLGSLASKQAQFTHANRSYFDALMARRASNDNGSGGQDDQLGRRLAKIFLKSYPFDPESTRVMDFGCGTGNVSRFLAPHARSIVGVDISQKMIDRYNEMCWEHGIELDEMRGVCVDVLHAAQNLQGNEGRPNSEVTQDSDNQAIDIDKTDTDEECREAEDRRHLREERLIDNLAPFDVILTGLALHHVPDVEGLMRRLVQGYLRPDGGVVLIADVLKEERSMTPTQLSEQLGSESTTASSRRYEHSEIVAHPGGFTEDEMKRALVLGGGLGGFEFSTAWRAKQHGKDAQIFLARGVTGNEGNTGSRT